MAVPYADLAPVSRAFLHFPTMPGMIGQRLQALICPWAA
jgi:hypothetical protein